MVLLIDAPNVLTLLRTNNTDVRHANHRLVELRHLQIPHFAEAPEAPDSLAVVNIIFNVSLPGFFLVDDCLQLLHSRGQPALPGPLLPLLSLVLFGYFLREREEEGDVLKLLAHRFGD